MALLPILPSIQLVTKRSLRTRPPARNPKLSPAPIWRGRPAAAINFCVRVAYFQRASGIGDLYRIYSICKCYGIDFNLTSIPPDFNEARKGPFDGGYMNALFDRGYDLASHNYSWVKSPPGLELATQAHN